MALESQRKSLLAEMNRRLPVPPLKEVPQVSEKVMDMRTQSTQDRELDSESIHGQPDLQVSIPKSSVGGNSEGESVLDDEPSEAKKRKERRADWQAQLFQIFPELAPVVEATPEDPGSWLFGSPPAADKKQRLPIYKGLFTQLEKRAEQHFARVKKGKSPWPAAAKIAQHYRAREPEEALLGAMYSVSSALLDEVPKDRTKGRVMGTEARLLPKSEGAKVEKAALDKIQAACTGFRLSNNLSLDLKAALNVTQEGRILTAEFRSKPALGLHESELSEALVCRETEVSEFAATISKKLTMIEEAIEDAILCSSDHFNMESAAFLNAVVERRQAWLSASEIPEEVQKEMSSLPIALPSTGKEGPLDLLGPEATKRLGTLQDSREKARNKAISNFAEIGASVQAKAKQNKGFQAFAKPKVPQPKAQVQAAPTFKSPLATPQSAPFQGRGAFRGRGRGGRGRGGGSYRGRGNQKPTSGRGQPAADPQ